MSETSVGESPILAGIFVGGRSRRMGGVPKGLLPAPDTGEPLVARLARLCSAALPGSDVVLVGDAAAYASLELEAIADTPPGVGPLGGLVALLEEAERRGLAALALACDLPAVTGSLLARLATYTPGAAAVAPRDDGRWHPLFARYAPNPCLSAARDALLRGERALHRVLSHLGPAAIELPLDAAERRALADWDSPADRRRS